MYIKTEHISYYYTIITLLLHIVSLSYKSITVCIEILNLRMIQKYMWLTEWQPV